MQVCVVGLGKVGLPLAASFALHGQQVIGCDIDTSLVDELEGGGCPLPGEEGLADALSRARQDGSFKATTDTSGAVSRSDVVIVIVPLLIDERNEPRFEALDAATEAIGRRLRPGTLVIYETSLPVGTTRGRFGPGLQLHSGLTPGVDFDLAFSPERVYSGRVIADLGRYPKVVGGTTGAAGERAAAFYRQALGVEVMALGDAETAEFAKLAEAVYRDTNIALANELARTADALGLDVIEAIEAANSQPFSHIHAPGVGVGGHCIPVYPHFLIHSPGEHRLVRAGRAVNDEMAEYAVARLEAEMGDLAGLSIVILGLAYRPNVKEAAHSSTFGLTRALESRRADVRVHDPLFTKDEIAALGLRPQPDFPATADAVILQAPHRQYLDLGVEAFRGCRVLLDGRNALDRSEIERLGIRYLGIGR